MKKRIIISYIITWTTRVYAVLLCWMLSVGELMAQSDVTHRISSSQKGYRGRVAFVHKIESCSDSAYLFSYITDETYNKEGLLTDRSHTENMLYQYNVQYYYNDKQQLVSFVENYDCEKDSIFYQYGTHGCLTSYSEYYLSKDPTEGNSVTEVSVVCDDQCRPLMCISIWEDTTSYTYDPAGRLIRKKTPTKQEQYFYDPQGRMAKIRTGGKEYEDQHFRYNTLGDTLETWHTNWEHLEGETTPHPLGKHKYYTYTQYDKQGNWLQAEVRVSEGEKTYQYTISRTIRYH